MRPIKTAQFVAYILIIILNATCVKDKASLNTRNSPSLFPPPPPHPPPSNTAPTCNAGDDKLVFFPTNFYTLNGAAQDLEKNIQTILWSKISGASSFLIEHPDSLSTKVSNLQIGDYQFELTVTDSMGRYGKDTIRVSVSNMNEKILQNQKWIFPWYNAIEVKDFYNIIPSGSLFKIFIRRDTNPVWIEANPVTNNITAGSYEYFIETRPDGAGMYNYRSLYIFYYGMDTEDTPDVKIVF